MKYFVGACLGFTIGATAAMQKFDKRDLIEECEKQLTRNEVCVLKAVPKLTTNKE